MLIELMKSYPVRSRHNSRFYAIKIMSKQKIVLAKEELRVCREQSVLQAVRHPFIVNLWAAFQDSDNLYMVMEFVRGGELGTLLRRSARFPEPVAKYYAAEIALALSYLHDKGIVHRDLNLTNIMLSHDGHIRLVDFGMAKTDTSAMPKSSKNLHYRAPEAIVSERYSTSVDWYALGVLIFEMLYGSPPFYEPNISPAVLHERIVQGTPPIKWPAFHLNAKDLIIKLMVRDPSRRLGNNQNGKGDVFVHRWFREVDWEKLVNKEIRPPYIPQFSDEGDTNAFAQFPGGDDAMDCCGKIGLDLYGERFPAFEYSEALA
ncbi:kinase-like protein [Cubamyces menziesii]|nr:kinase-like protein [Cubamyces menziesii]